MLRMRFSLSKYKMWLQDGFVSSPELMIGSEVVERIDRLTYLGCLVGPEAWRNLCTDSKNFIDFRQWNLGD